MENSFRPIVVAKNYFGLKLLQLKQQTILKTNNGLVGHVRLDGINLFKRFRPVQGIWPPCSKGDDINSVDLNNDKEEGRAVMATGDDFGKIKLFKYPCIQENAGFVSFGGHSD